MNGINTSSYKEMLQLYKQTKEQYINESVTIDFMGVSDDGQINIFFSKKIVGQEEIKENTKPIDLIKNIQENLDLLIKKETKTKGELGVWNKKQDITLHRIENFNKANFKNQIEINNEKLNLFNNLEEIRLKRRAIKNDIKLFDLVESKIDIGKTLESLNNIINQYNSYINKVEYLTDEKLEEKHIMKEVKYKNDKERLNLMKQLQGKYDRLQYSGGIITCYNRSR
jgi:hypothetical protein